MKTFNLINIHCLKRFPGAVIKQFALIFLSL